MQQQSPFRPPMEEPFLDANKQMSFGWKIHIDLTAQQLKTPANQPSPALSNAPGQFGQLALDVNGNLYAYVGTKWMRIQLLNF